MSKFYLCEATEVDGERERLIDFLLRAVRLKDATAEATTMLQHEWGDDEMDEQTEAWRESWGEGCVATFGCGQLAIKDLRLRVVTVDEAIKHFTRK